MNKFLITLIIPLLLPCSTFAQYWAPIGAKWHYDPIDYMPPAYGTVYIYESIGDTLIHGDSARIIRFTSKSLDFQGDTHYLHRNTYSRFDSNRVYFYDQSLDSFML